MHWIWKRQKGHTFSRLLLSSRGSGISWISWISRVRTVVRSNYRICRAQCEMKMQGTFVQILLRISTRPQKSIIPNTRPSLCRTILHEGPCASVQVMSSWKQPWCISVKHLHASPNVAYIHMLHSKEVWSSHISNFMPFLWQWPP